MVKDKIKSITFLISGLTKGGSERVISILSNEYVKKNIKVNVISMRSTICAYEFDSKVNVIFLDKGSKLSESFYSLNPYKIFYSLFRLYKVLRKQNPDIIVSFGESSNVYAIFSKLFLKIKVVICMRQDPIRVSPLIRVIVKLFYRYADHLIVQTQYQKNWSKQYFEKLEITQMNNPIPFQFRWNNYFKNHKDIDFLSVGTIKSEKNYSDTIIAYNNIKNRINSEAKLYIAGRFMTEYSKKQIYSLIDKHNLKEKVVLLGDVKDINSIYQRAKIYILSSSNEGQPNALLESLSHGIPCISSRWSGADDIFTNNHNIMMFDVGDIDKLSYLMLHLFNNEDLRNRIGENGYNFCRENFEKDLMISKWLNLLNSI
tara:strand:- start:1867 stop:2982 length:1116 start_codon:yes stop_codon:yes gene_type:complete